MSDLVVAVDVGTGSARAGVLDRTGRLLGRAEHPIRMNRPQPEHADQSTTDIWQAVGRAVRDALAEAGAERAAVKGISFDATCSPVVLDRDGGPVTVSTGGDPDWDTIVWLDHRAVAEAEECTATGHRILNYIGGVMSPEMETPKLLWLKRRLPARWARPGLFFDLADFLTFKVSAAPARSQCTVTCKWTYLASPGWQRDFFGQLGAEDLLERGALPAVASPIREDLGPLTDEAAETLGLERSCRVGVGLIDAHAGALGVLGGILDPGGDAPDRHIGMIAGTRPATWRFRRRRATCRESGAPISARFSRACG
ncbi:MAG TPA: FGGY family carbohydrate kinase [Geminicoccaceae bacterium]|nr:FGGY family carbohydrate kinase [Geminicoccaceae bacterium]